MDKNEYKLTVYNNVYDLDEYKIYIFNSFNDAFEYTKDIILKHFYNEEQIYDKSNFLPFEAGAYISNRYDSLEITDEEIIIFEKLIIVLSNMFDDSFNIINFIKNDITYESNEDNISFQILKREKDNLILNISTEEGHFMTNMFNVRNDQEYYFFESSQTVVIKDEEAKRQLGEKTYLKVELERI